MIFILMDVVHNMKNALQLLTLPVKGLVFMLLENHNLFIVYTVGKGIG